MMEMLNAMYKAEKVDRFVAENFVLLLSPIAPHMMEELWNKLGHNDTLAYENWPAFDAAQLVENDVEVVVQIMGKKRAVITVPVDATQDEVAQIALNEERLQDFVAGKEIVKVIYVPKRLINIVVK